MKQKLSARLDKSVFPSPNCVLYAKSAFSFSRHLPQTPRIEWQHLASFCQGHYRTHFEPCLREMEGIVRRRTHADSPVARWVLVVVGYAKWENQYATMPLPFEANMAPMLGLDRGGEGNGSAGSRRRRNGRNH